MEWIKYTLLCIKRNLNIFILILLILTAVLLYKFANLKLDLIALIFSPLFTLSILPIVEEYKSKWNTKYETFKFLYANRDNLVNYNVVQHLNLIDIVFYYLYQINKRNYLIFLGCMHHTLLCYYFQMYYIVLFLSLLHKIRLNHSYYYNL